MGSWDNRGNSGANDEICATGATTTPTHSSTDSAYFHTNAPHGLAAVFRLDNSPIETPADEENEDKFIKYLYDMGKETGEDDKEDEVGRAEFLTSLYLLYFLV